MFDLLEAIYDVFFRGRLMDFVHEHPLITLAIVVIIVAVLGFIFSRII